MKFIKVLLLSALFVGCASQTKTNVAASGGKRGIASEVPNGFYKGQMIVTGNLELNSSVNKALKPMKSGEVMLILENPGLVHEPVRLWNGDRNLILREADWSEYFFEVPKELLFKEGTISVSKKSSKQNAHLVIKKTQNLIKTYEETLVEKCGVIGAQEILYKTNIFTSKINAKIYNDSGSAEINTSEFSETERAPIKELTRCE